MRIMLRKAMLKLRGSKRYEYLREYERLQWQPFEVIETYQFARLKKLLEHAHETVPYYRGIFKELGFHPDDIKTWTDFSKLPILTKDIIKAHKSDLISTLFKPQDLIGLSSGGSTGEPLQFLTNHDFYEQHYATFMLGLKMAGWKEEERLILIWGNPNDVQKKSGLVPFLKRYLSTTLVLNAYKYDENTICQWIDRILEGKNTFIYGYVSVVQNIAEQIIQKKIQISNVKGVMTSAEKLQSWQRNLIEQAFNCKVYDQYGSREVPGIASECPNGNMHQFLHSAYLEFLPVDDQSENIKKVIATSLINNAMPFIRYEIGDFAMPREGQCECGSGFPLMEMKIGRIADRFITSSGKTIYGTFFVRQMYGIDGVKNFQFHQINTRSIKLYLVKNNIFSELDLQKISQVEKKIKEYIGWNDLNLEIHYVDEIPKTVGGKHRYIISEVSHAHAT